MFPKTEDTDQGQKGASANRDKEQPLLGETAGGDDNRASEAYRGNLNYSER